MSRRRGTGHLRRKDPGRIGAVCYAACKSVDDLPEARQLAHDKVVELSGAARLGPVRWYEFGSAAGIATLMGMDAGGMRVAPSVGRDAGPGQYQPYIDLLRQHPEGRLVAAVVDVKHVYTGRVTTK